ncbi:hypothetical protein ACOMHN_017247 [Nucella lapillus]
MALLENNGVMIILDGKETGFTVERRRRKVGHFDFQILHQGSRQRHRQWCSSRYTAVSLSLLHRHNRPFLWDNLLPPSLVPRHNLSFLCDSLPSSCSATVKTLITQMDHFPRGAHHGEWWTLPVFEPPTRMRQAHDVRREANMAH